MVLWLISEVKIYLEIKTRTRIAGRFLKVHACNIYTSKHIKSIINLTETYCAILAVSPAACRHPQMPACFSVCCMEPPPNDIPSHFFTAPEHCKAQSIALFQYECAALKKNNTNAMIIRG